MMQGIARGSPAVDVTRSSDALAVVLEAASSQARELSEKLLKMSVQQVVQDTSVGTRIDTSA